MRISGAFKEWGKALVFALVAATIVNAFVFKVYAIPTPSMEGTLLVGDHIFVSKFHYGAQTAKTPIQFPLAHQTLFGFIPSYSELIQLPQFRFPGITKPQRGDKIVFNYPGELERPSDMRTYYIKRCIALPGDIVEVKNQIVYVNSEVSPEAPTMQHSYILAAKNQLTERFFEDNEIKEHFSTKDGFVVMATRSEMEKLKSNRSILNIQGLHYGSGTENQRLFQPNNANWGRDEYGPLQIPFKGMAISCNEQTLSLYGSLIQYYDQSGKAEIRNSNLYINGEVQREYNFKRDYFFAMGDNRHNSADSRMWGLIPDDHIVGKALFVLWSFDESVPWYYPHKKIRFNRIFKAA